MPNATPTVYSPARQLCPMRLLEHSPAQYRALCTLSSLLRLFFFNMGDCSTQFHLGQTPGCPSVSCDTQNKPPRGTMHCRRHSAEAGTSLTHTLVAQRSRGKGSTDCHIQECSGKAVTLGGPPPAFPTTLFPFPGHSCQEIQSLL